MDIKQLRAFVITCETKNITKTATLLNIVQPAVSRQIIMLEEELGVKLFERTKLGLYLTEEGKTLETYATKVLNDLEQAKLELTNFDREVKGTINIGILSTLSEILSVSLVKSIREKFPKVQINLVVAFSGHLKDWLINGEIDIAVLYDLEPNKLLKYRKIYNESLFILGSHNTMLDRNKKIKVEDLAKYPLIQTNAPHGLRVLVDAQLKSRGLIANTVIETNDLNMQKRLTQEGLGYTILPLSCVSEEILEGKLKYSPIDSLEFMRVMDIVTPNNRKVSRLLSLIEIEIEK